MATASFMKNFKLKKGDVNSFATYMDSKPKLVSNTKFKSKMVNDMEYQKIIGAFKKSKN